MSTSKNESNNGSIVNGSIELEDFEYDSGTKLFLLDKETYRYGNGSSFCICKGVKNDIAGLLSMYGLKK